MKISKVARSTLPIDILEDPNPLRVERNISLRNIRFQCEEKELIAYNSYGDQKHYVYTGEGLPIYKNGVWKLYSAWSDLFSLFFKKYTVEAINSKQVDYIVKVPKEDFQKIQSLITASNNFLNFKAILYRNLYSKWFEVAFDEFRKSMTQEDAQLLIDINISILYQSLQESFLALPSKEFSQLNWNNFQISNIYPFFNFLQNYKMHLDTFIAMTQIEYKTQVIGNLASLLKLPQKTKLHS